MKAETFAFEGAIVTAQDLAVRFTAYSESWILTALRKGCATREEMFALAEKNRCSAQRGAIKGKRIFKRNNPMTRRCLFGKGLP